MPLQPFTAGYDRLIHRNIIESKTKAKQEECMMKQVIQTNNAPQAIGPYSQAIMANDTLYVSGQIPVIPATGVIVSDQVEEQARQVMENVKAVVEAAG